MINYILNIIIPKYKKKDLECIIKIINYNCSNCKDPCKIKDDIIYTKNRLDKIYKK